MLNWVKATGGKEKKKETTDQRLGKKKSPKSLEGSQKKGEEKPPPLHYSRGKWRVPKTRRGHLATRARGVKKGERTGNTALNPQERV